MTAELEAVDGPLEGSIAIAEDFDVIIGNQDDQVAFESAALQDARHKLENPNHKLATIGAILDDKFQSVEQPKEKMAAVEAILADQFRVVHDQENASNQQTQFFDNPEEKLDQIEEIVLDKSEAFEHPHQKFASIEAILGNHSKSSNPWVQAHQSLSLIEDSSRKLIKAEEKRQKELREAWKKEMDEKADHYVGMADSQEKWKWGGGTLTAVSFGLPFFGLGIGNFTINKLAPKVSLINKVVAGLEPKDIEGYVRMGSETLRQSGSQFVQEGSQISQFHSKHGETTLDWSTQQERQDLEQQGQVVQEARQNDNSLKERHLEVIKTLTSQIVGR